MDKSPCPMFKIGIVGGVAWPSTLDYYRLICAGASRHFAALGLGRPLPVPPMTIESVVQAETRALRGVEGDEASWAAFDDHFRQALLRLQAAGCDFGLIANNTTYMRIEAIRQGVAMPILDMLDVVADAASELGATRALVLGTPVTMQSPAYGRALAMRGIAVNDPLPRHEIAELQEKIDTVFHEPGTPEGRRAILDLCAAHVTEPEATAVLLACTELPLAWPEHAEAPVFRAGGYTLLNTTALHAKAALERAIGGPLA